MHARAQRVDLAESLAGRLLSRVLPMSSPPTLFPARAARLAALRANSLGVCLLVLGLAPRRSPLLCELSPRPYGPGRSLARPFLSPRRRRAWTVPFVRSRRRKWRCSDMSTRPGPGTCRIPSPSLCSPCLNQSLLHGDRPHVLLVSFAFAQNITLFACQRALSARVGNARHASISSALQYPQAALQEPLPALPLLCVLAICRVRLL